MLRVGSLIRDVPQRTRAPLPLVALMVRAAAKEVIARQCDDLPIEIFKQIKVTTFKNGVLVVVAPRLVRVELQMRSGGLKDAINSELKKKLIRDLIFRNS